MSNWWWIQKINCENWLGSKVNVQGSRNGSEDKVINECEGKRKDFEGHKIRS